MNECDHVGTLSPVWYIEAEYRTHYGALVQTGRTRRAVSHLACSWCFRNVSVDGDYLAGPWVESTELTANPAA